MVTGGASGIGKETSLMLASRGVHVVIVDCDHQGTEFVVNEIKKKHGHALGVCIDFLNEDVDFEKIIDDVDSNFGPPNILVNCAGVSENIPALKTSKELWTRMMRVNLDSCFFCSQAVAKAMIKSRADGRIVNISSHGGLFGSTGQVAYSASKAGLLAVTRVLAVELAEHGITVNAIAPGPVITPMSAKHNKDRKTAWMNALPIQRYSTVEDITAAILFFCQESASHITGQTLCVDGGFSASGLIMRESWSDV